MSIAMKVYLIANLSGFISYDIYDTSISPFVILSLANCSKRFFVTFSNIFILVNPCARVIVPAAIWESPDTSTSSITTWLVDVPFSCVIEQLFSRVVPQPVVSFLGEANVDANKVSFVHSEAPVQSCYCL